MKNYFSKRRDFIKIAIAGGLASSFYSLVSPGVDNKNRSRRRVTHDKDFVIVNGWVLLASDVALD